jgi:hypothetical protein
MSDEQNGGPVVIQTSLDDYKDAIRKLHAETIEMKGGMLETSAILTAAMLPGTEVALLVGTNGNFQTVIRAPLANSIAPGRMRIGFFFIPER